MDEFDPLLFGEDGYEGDREAQQEEDADDQRGSVVG